VNNEILFRFLICFYFFISQRLFIDAVRVHAKVTALNTVVQKGLVFNDLNIITSQRSNEFRNAGLQIGSV